MLPKTCIHISASFAKLCILQNHRTLGVGRDLWRSSHTTPLLDKVHPEQGTQERIQVDFECLQGRRLHNLSGQPVPLLCHPHRKEVFSHIEVEHKGDLRPTSTWIGFLDLVPLWTVCRTGVQPCWLQSQQGVQ